MANLLSAEIDLALKSHGISSNTQIGVIDCDRVVPSLAELSSDNRVVVHASCEDAARSARGHRLTVLLVGAESATALLRAINAESVSVGVIGYVPEDSSVSPSVLRSFGIMEVVRDLAPEGLVPLFRRGLDFRALLALELAHRCESKRLHQRELELLGHPPETMSDDLNAFQPPPLPVGPMSTYNLDEASEAFEKAYIDRVQQLCASSREAAVHLGVSSATLSRRLRKENTLHGE